MDRFYCHVINAVTKSTIFKTYFTKKAGQLSGFFISEEFRSAKKQSDRAER
ncbi:hypothetical protein CLV48_11320 [Cecembia rubra]|uniref:Uncharacterized protein n=1 Tax=Cecembia rubra TaxID=1485585 RepID=A0A2P8DW78_9BACT|nr:hypothetical protein CLV48_11320 [Cecembia rubra]